jgi:hypothetical protein
MTTYGPLWNMLGPAAQTKFTAFVNKMEGVECPGTPVNVIYCRLCVTGEFVPGFLDFAHSRINEGMPDLPTCRHLNVTHPCVS